MRRINLHGHTFLRDRDGDNSLTNQLGILVDLDRAVLLVGMPGERDMEELAFHDRSVRYALLELVNALRRHAYRRRPITPVPKPRPVHCDVCEGRRTIRNPFSGEVFTCPACR